MRIFCRGFNLYNQLNSKDEKCLGEFQETFVLDDVVCFELSYTFSVIVSKNKLKINSNLCDTDALEKSKLIGNIKQVAVNDTFLLILDDFGKLFKALTQDNWQIQPIAKFLEDNDKVRIISCGSTLSVAYSENGSLYSIPEKLEFANVEVVDVKTGREHCLLLDKGGNVYAFGAGSRGQLGQGHLDEHINPVLVEALAGIKMVKIAAGGWHSAAISQDGDLYTWGWNGNGQLGLADSVGETNQTVSVMACPHLVDILGCEENRVVDVACGSKHTIVLLDNGVLYGCGWNKYKQLKDDEQENYYSFICMRDFPQDIVDRIVCGPWNSAVMCKK